MLHSNVKKFDAATGQVMEGRKKKLDSALASALHELTCKESQVQSLQNQLAHTLQQLAAFTSHRHSDLSHGNGHQSHIRIDPLHIFATFPEIQERILTHLNIPSLLHCRLVNKNWHVTSTRILFNFKKSSAYIGRQASCISELLAFNNRLSKSAIIPFNSLTVFLKSTNHQPCLAELPQDSLGDCFNFIFQVPWKHLQLRLPDCFGNRLIGKIIWESRASVQEISIDCDTEEKSRYLQSEMKGHQGALFPKLKSVTVPSEKEFAHLFALYVVNVAPNLQSLRGKLRLAGLRYFNEAQFSTLKDVTILVNTHMNRNIVIRPQPFSVVPAETLAKFSVCGLKLESLTILSAEKMSNVTLTLLCGVLQKCRSTLKYLSIGCKELVRIVEMDVVVLPRLKELELGAMPEGAQSGPTVRSLLGRLKIAANFPNVSTVAIKFHWSSWVSDAPDWNHHEEQRSSDLNLNVTLDGDRWPLEVLEFFVGTFPKVKIFEFDIPNERDVQWRDLWRIWSELECLKVLKINGKKGVPDDFSFDALLCGISGAECMKLLKESRAGVICLEELELVPARKSLLAVKNLRRLEISVTWNSGKKICISEVAGALVFQRMNDLDVYIEGPIRCAKDMSYLLPFAELSYY